MQQTDKKKKTNNKTCTDTSTPLHTVHTSEDLNCKVYVTCFPHKNPSWNNFSLLFCFFVFNKSSVAFESLFLDVFRATVFRSLDFSSN